VRRSLDRLQRVVAIDPCSRRYRFCSPCWGKAALFQQRLAGDADLRGSAELIRPGTLNPPTTPMTFIRGYTGVPTRPVAPLHRGPPLLAHFNRHCLPLSDSNVLIVDRPPTPLSRCDLLLMRSGDAEPAQGILICGGLRRCWWGRHPFHVKQRKRTVQSGLVVRLPSMHLTLPRLRDVMFHVKRTDP
jgi:hypothetical protein